MENNKYHVLVVSDIHFGAMNALDLYKELQQFIDDVKNYTPNMVVILGDLYHKKINLNEPSAKYSIKFINDLIDCAKKQEKPELKIRIVKGTNSHDLDQLDNFRYLETEQDVDIKIINKFCSEELPVEQIKILYIPEEYITKEDYGPILKKGHDLCFVHGTFDFVPFVKLLEKTSNLRYPIWKMEDFNVKGPIISGHIHKFMNHENKVYYPGSFSRWCFGEEEEKGHLFMRYVKGEPLLPKYVQRRENKLCKKYSTMSLVELQNSVGILNIYSLNSTDIKKLNSKIRELKKEKGFQSLRIKTDDVDESRILFLRETLLDVEIKSGRRRKENEEEESLRKEYGYLFDKSLNTFQKISMYIDKTERIKLDPGRIEELILS